MRKGDRTIDPITKQAWRRCLADQWGIRLPRRIDERRDPEKADEIYAHAVECCERCIGDRTTRPGLWEAAVERDLLINGPDWLANHVRAWSNYGVAPAIVVPDNPWVT